MSDEKHFTLSVMKFVFGLRESPFPDKYQNKLDVFGENHQTLTDNIKHAVRFIPGEFCYTSSFTGDIESVEYKKAFQKLERDFNLGDFLMFMTWYLHKFVCEKSEQKRALVYYDIINILKDKAIISESLKDLDKTAKKYISGIDMKCRDLNYTGLYEINMLEEKKFLLKLIDYIYLLHFRSLPEKFKKKVKAIPPCDNDPFTNNVTHALAVLLNNQIKDIKNVGEKSLMDQYFNLNLKSFNKRYFLEFCVSQSRKAAVEFIEFDNLNYHSPQKTFRRMKRMLKAAKIKGLFTRLDRMEEVALQIITEDIERSEKETFKNKSSVVYEECNPLRPLSISNKLLEKSLNQKEAVVVNALESSSQSLEEALETEKLQNELLCQETCKSKTDADEKYKPLKPLSDLDKSIEISLVNQEEIAAVHPLENSSQNLEEAAETPLLPENNKSSSKCCDCS